MSPEQSKVLVHAGDTLVLDRNGFLMLACTICGGLGRDTNNLPCKPCGGTGQSKDTNKEGEK